MSSLSNIINYLKSCYQVDFKAISIFNFFGKKVEDQLILESAELLSGKLIQYPVDSIWGAQMEQQLALHSQEKALYAGAFFLNGKMNVIGKAQKVLAPLYIYPVNLLKENDVYYLSIEEENAVINPVFVDFIKSQISETDFHYDDLESALPKGFIRFDEAHQIEETLGQFIPDLDLSKLDDFPELLTKNELSTIYKKRNNSNTLSLLPSIGIGFMQKPSGSRGILNELEKMSIDQDYSAVIRDLFFTPSIQKTSTPSRKILSPVTLSKSQLDIFDSYEKHRTSLVIGPPGTGKSFTIAALAVELISRGQSVLIASKNNQAGAVIAHKIEQDFGLKGVVIKTKSQTYRRVLEKRLNNIFYGIEVQKVDRQQIQLMENEVHGLYEEMTDLENILQKREREELEWGTFFYHYKNNFFQRFRKRLIEYKIYSRSYVWQLMKRLNGVTKIFQKRTKILIRKKFDFFLYKALSNHRQQMQSLLHALQSDSGNLMQSHFEKTNFNVILHALPAWIVNASNVHKSLPLQKELFDVVIIDEATQCDIASSLPLLQRARKAIIVGDPKQLRHISFLSKTQQQQFLEKNELASFSNTKINYRKNSLLDLVSESIPSQDQVHFLDEHYRSMPDIIGFSNQNFYQNRLKIMTATPVTLKEKNVVVHQIAGQRNPKGYNEQEADKIITMVNNIIEKEKKLSKNLCQSIGILSPFRPQVNHIKSKIRKLVDLKHFKRHQILIGTPFQFQGEEKDVMMISFVVDDQAHPSTYLYLNRPDVFNVSITRARSLQHLFTSVTLDQLNPKYLFTKYIQEAASNTFYEIDRSNYEEADDFLEEVVGVLQKWKINQIYKSYPIAGIEIDIVVIHLGLTYCIDLIGFPGQHQDSFPIQRWKILDRMGVKTFSLPYSSWHIQKKKSMAALKKFLFPKK